MTHHSSRAAVAHVRTTSSSRGSSPLRARAAHLVARVRAWTWLAIAARTCAVVGALLVLGWIGRSAAAGAASATSSLAAEIDASRALASIDGGALLASTASATPRTTTANATPASTASSDAPPSNAPPTSTAHGHATPSEPVYLNHASVDDLRRLPGVGPKRAEAILVLRQRLGRFQRVEDLLRVKGLGRAAVKKWRPLVRLDAPSAPPAPPAPTAPEALAPPAQGAS